MKKLILILLFALFSISSFSQDYFTSKFWNRLTADTLIVNEWLIYKGDTILFPTYMSARDLKIKRVADPVDLTDAVNLQTLLANVSGFDSVDYNVLGDGYLRFLSSAIVTDSVLLDERHVLLSDSTVVFVTPTQLNDSLANYTTTDDLSDNFVQYSDSTDTYYSQHYLDSALAVAVAGAQNTFTITLASGGSSGDIQTRINGATEVPPDWILTADGLNIDIEHNLGRYCNMVTIFSTTTDPANQQLTNTAAHNGLVNVDTNNTKILSLATIQKEIRIFISFTQ